MHADPTEAIRANTVTITPLRMACLQMLADGQRWSVDSLPRPASGGRLSVSVWGPLADAGFMTLEAGCATITDTGRAVLEKALRVAANKGENDA